MTWFLAWLYSQAQKALYWFGDAFYGTLNIILNIGAYAYAAAESAYNRAVNFAYSLLQDTISLALQIRDWAAGQIGWLLSQVYSYYNLAVAYANAIRDAIYSWTQSFVSGVYAALLSIAYSIRDTLNAFILSQVAYALAWVSNTFGWLLAPVLRWQEVLSWLDGLKFWTIIDPLVRFFSTLLLFLQNPIVFILDLIEPKVITFLCYVLAWSLGTTIYDLPKPKPWKV